MARFSPRQHDAQSLSSTTGSHSRTTKGIAAVPWPKITRDRLAAAYWVRLLNACIRGEIRLGMRRLRAIDLLLNRVLPDVEMPPVNRK